MKIKLLALDIDGVLTNGKVFIDIACNEYKSLNFRDLDAITWLKEYGIIVVLLTGENTALVDTIAKRFGIINVFKAAKDKKSCIQQVSKSLQVPLENICYVGDSDRDAEALNICGLGIVPGDATAKAKESVDVCLASKGGDGVVHEVKEFLIKNDYITLKQ